MDQFQWGPAFDVHVPLMNHEHKKLIEQMRTISALCKKSRPKQEIVKAYDLLIKYTEEHFSDEEVMLEKMKYKELESHKKLHRSMLEKLHKYRQEFANSVYAILPSSVFDFFENWLLTHILIVDQRYGEIVKKIPQ